MSSNIGSRMKKLVKFILSKFLFCGFFLFVSCASSRLHDSTFNGLVYDAYNEPVSNAIIYLDGKQKTASDIYGHFFITDLDVNKTYELKAKKKDFEDVTIVFDYESVSQLAYVKMYSYKYLLEQAEIMVAEKRFDFAINYLDRVDAINPENISSLYLRAIVLYLTGIYDKAIEILSELETNNKHPYIYLLLADCYEYGTHENELAKEYLTKFLALTASEEITERLNSL